MSAPKWAEKTAANDALILRTFEERPDWFALRIESRLERDGDCLIWSHASDTRYGMVQLPPGVTGMRSKVVKVHRVAYLHAYGAIGYGLALDHVCERTFCANPTHLVIATQAENIARAALSGRMDRFPTDWVAKAEALVLSHWGGIA